MTWRRRGIIVLHEAVSGIVWLPLVVVLFVAFLALPVLAPLYADLERAWAKRAGFPVPGRTRRVGEGVLEWVSRRRREGLIFREDLALFGVVIAIGLPDAVLTFVAVMGPVLLISAPLNPGSVGVRDGEGFLPVAVAMAMGPVLLALGLAGLWVAGALRVRLIGALSQGREDELLAELGQLRRGRVTLVDAFEAERRRIERDLHDGAQQQLVAVAFALGRAELAARRLPAGVERTATLDAISAAHARAETALGELRESVRRIHPAVLSDRGLFAGVRDLAGHAGGPVEVALSGDDSDVSGPVAAAAYFIVAEALTNAAKHAPGAGARVEVSAGADVRVLVSDGGPGGADAGAGTGLAGLVERAETVGGVLVVDSPPGGPTTIRATLPLEPAWTLGVAAP